MHARTKKHFRCLTIAFIFTLLLNDSQRIRSFQTPPLRDANLSDWSDVYAAYKEACFKPSIEKYFFLCPQIKLDGLTAGANRVMLTSQTLVIARKFSDFECVS